jgi:hypothetical protein
VLDELELDLMLDEELITELELDLTLEELLTTELTTELEELDLMLEELLITELDLLLATELEEMPQPAAVTPKGAGCAAQVETAMQLLPFS